MPTASPQPCSGSWERQSRPGPQSSPLVHVESAVIVELALDDAARAEAPPHAFTLDLESAVAIERLDAGEAQDILNDAPFAAVVREARGVKLEDALGEGADHEFRGAHAGRTGAES